MKDIYEGVKDLRQALEEVIAEPVHDLAGADRVAEAAALRRELLHLDARARALLERPVAGAAAQRAAQRAPEYGTRVAGPFAGMTLHGAARIALERAGIPLHVRDLGARLKAGGWRHPRSVNARPDQIEYQLAARLPRHPEGFIRTAPNTFGLVGRDQPRIGPKPRPQLPVFDGPDQADGASFARWMSEHPDEAFAGWDTDA